MGHPQASPTTPSGPPVGLRPVSVLVIDDEQDTRDMLAALLANAGYSVATACNGDDALAKLGSLQPEMILLDIQMPIMDGAHFREAQRRNPQLLAIPTVVMTGSHEESTLDVAVAGVLRKPFRTNDLLTLVSSHCQPPRR